MANRRYWNEVYYPQPTETQLKKNASETAKKAKKKGQTLNPVVITGRKIAKSWWGQAWCANLERYADFQTRLPRGQRYVKTGAVVDLKIEKGKLAARVQGSRKTPYKVEVRVSPLSEERCQEIISRCTERVDTLENLLSGSFPKSLKEVFLGAGGLFPTPREISFSCSCPDWALMCKHIAAVLYGVGARLDDDPMMFFSLRGIDTEKFVETVISSRLDTMLKNADKPSERILTGSGWETLFGVIEEG